MRIPNSFVTRFTQAADLKLACVFYSLIHSNTKRNLLGYEITVKQSTLMSLCGCSLFHKITETSNDYTRQARNIYIHY